MRTAILVLMATFPLALQHGQLQGQQTFFLGVGGGASVPVGSERANMNNGVLLEVMGGMVLPGNFMSVRLGAMHARHRVAEQLGMEFMPGGTSRVTGGMAGVMVMPDWDWDWVPYAHASAGALRATFHGSDTSFAWSTGAGATLKWRTFDFFVEGRYLQARNAGHNGQMMSATTGIRLVTY